MSADVPSLAVNVAVIDGDRVLLTQREDFEVWCLPGGEVEFGESIAEAALREVREKLSLEVELGRLVGLYSRPWLRGYHTAVVFSARVVGGVLWVDPDEVSATEYFALAELPDGLLWGQRERIVDALSGVGGSIVRSTDVVRPYDVPWEREELYAARDASGLKRAAYYRTIAEAFGADESPAELEPPASEHPPRGE